jgi:uncharacterized protein (DUF1015 family)
LRLNPFRALRPAPALVAEVAAVPYDVVNRDEAAGLAAGNPHSFLHVGRSDIDLPAGTDPHDDRVYAAAREALDRLQRDGTLIRDEAPGFYLYRQVMDGRAQTGLVGCVHIDDYENDVIRKHEKTRKDKEDDRTRHVLELNANAEPVFLTYRARPELDRLADPITREAPLYDFTAADGVRHVVWRVADTRPWAELFGTIPVAYVADGHHRSASAWRAGRELQRANPDHHGNEEYNWFLAVLFPADQLRILPYNRVVRDLGGQSPAQVLERLRGVGALSDAPDPVPPRAGTVCVYLDGRWHLLAFDPARIDAGDPIRSLDVSLLQELVLGPVLGVGDPRTDARVDFVGGIRGTADLERRVDAGDAAIAFSMHPTTLDQLMAVADAGEVMPPKSTWFEPKLRSGLFVHTLDPAPVNGGRSRA